MPPPDREKLLAGFLDNCGWGKAERRNLAGDASFRRYERLFLGDKTAVLMDAPPPQEDVRPFVKIARHLKTNNLSAPEIFAEDVENGFLLLEDLGDSRYTTVLSGKSPLPSPSEKELYKLAIDTLVEIQKLPLPQDIPSYGDELLMREVLLLTEWYIPRVFGDKYGDDDLQKLQDEYVAIWERLFQLLENDRQVLVLRDYHADNLMWLPEREGVEKVGLLDFQDAVTGSPAYDLLSLLEDARRDVAPELAEEMVDYYLSLAPETDKDNFLLLYNLLAAQRNCKIVGIFARLSVRDGKDTYLQFLPRVWGHIERDLHHPTLAELKEWMDGVVPKEKRW